MGKPGDGVCDSCFLGRPDPDVEASVLFQRWFDVPCILSVDSPRFLVCWFVMSDYMDAGRCNRGCVVVELAVEVFMGRKFGVHAGSPEEVECEFCLWDQFVPEVKGKLWVCCAKARDEVVLECADCAFCCIASMDAWGCELEFDALGTEKLLENITALIVESMEFWAAPSGD